MKIFSTVGINDFKWWKIWGIFVIVIGLAGSVSVIIFFYPYHNNDWINLSIFISILLLGIGIMRYSRICFLISAIITPIIVIPFLGLVNKEDNFIFGILFLWIYNIVYMINRWCHPKVNKGKLCGKYLKEKQILENFRKGVGS